MQLTSPKNPFLQSVRRAANDGRPTESGLVVAEGPHLTEEAVRSTSKWIVERILTTTAGRERHAELLRRAKAEIIEISAQAFRSVSETGSNQEILALLRPPQWSRADAMGSDGPVVVLDGIQDPGNAGTIVRSAEAFCAGGVVFLEGSARVANGKLLRATAGSIFRVPFLEEISRTDLVAETRRRNLPLYALTPRGELTVTQADFRQPCVLAVGSEGGGISSEVLANARTVAVPVAKVESLNAAVACSIALFEAARQRRKA